MELIIKLEMENDKCEYIDHVEGAISSTPDENKALKMDFCQAMQTSLALGTLGIRHMLVKKS